MSEIETIHLQLDFIPRVAIFAERNERLQVRTKHQMDEKELKETLQVICRKCQEVIEALDFGASVDDAMSSASDVSDNSPFEMDN